ncbi:hypothetical protein STEG23_000373 [Scotinomys teguina]
MYVRMMFKIHVGGADNYPSSVHLEAQVQKSILRRTIHRRHKNRSTRASLKNLKNALRDIRRALSFENIHLVNVELSNSDSEEEDEVTPNNSVDTSD